MIKFMPIKERYEWSFVKTFVDNYVAILKERNFNITSFCESRGIKKQFVYALKCGSYQYPLTFQSISAMAKSVDMDILEVINYKKQ